MDTNNWAEIQPVGQHHKTPVLVVSFIAGLLLADLFALYFLMKPLFFILAILLLALFYAVAVVRFDADHQLICLLRSYYCQYFDYTVAYKKVNHELKETIKDLENRQRDK